MVFAVVMAVVIVAVVELGKRLPISSLRPHEQFLHAFLGFEATDPPSLASPQLGTGLALTAGAPLSSSSSSTRPASCQDPPSKILVWAASGQKNVLGETQNFLSVGGLVGPNQGAERAVLKGESLQKKIVAGTYRQRSVEGSPPCSMRLVAGHGAGLKHLHLCTKSSLLQRKL